MKLLQQIETPLVSGDLEEVLRLTMEHLRADTGTIHLLEGDGVLHLKAASGGIPAPVLKAVERSEERRVGKECSLPCRSRWSPYH